MIIALDNLRSALNVGSILRTCDALGIKEIYFCGITPGPNHPKVKKTSLGAEDNIIPHEESNTAEIVKELKKEGRKIVGLEINKDAIDVKTVSIPDDFVLVVGNEVSGISEDVLALCDLIVKIPMRGNKESLNVAVAFGIAAYALSKN